LCFILLVIRWLHPLMKRLSAGACYVIQYFHTYLDLDLAVIESEDRRVA
jgi:hypothetical protein